MVEKGSMEFHNILVPVAGTKADEGAIELACSLAKQAGRKLILIANVTGTEHDPQVRSQQVAALEGVGMIVCESNASAARLAGMIFQS